MKNNNLRFLFTMLVSFSVLWAGTVWTARKLAIPPALVPSFGINEKLQFLREHESTGPVTLVMGASVASNNLDSDLMQATEGRQFVNAGAYGLALDDNLRLYEMLLATRQIAEVILVSQYYEYRKRDSGLPASNRTLSRYLGGRMSIPEQASYYQLEGFRHYQTHWQDLRTPTTASSVVFNRTGAVPLDMDVRKTDPSHQTARVLSTGPCKDCTAALLALCRKVVSSGRPFAAVLGPVQLAAIEDLPLHQQMRADRRQRIAAALSQCGGILFDAGAFAGFSDECFADYSHLNRRGMEIFTRMFLDFRAGKLVPPDAPVRCS
jgi:hypothetical protein